MVEVEGARVLVPSCSRAVEAGMVVRTGNDRVRHTRKMVLELLASSVDLSTTPGMDELLDEYECEPERYGPPAPPSHAGVRDAAVCGHHAPPNPEYAATVAQPPKIDNDLYIRDYAQVRALLQVRRGVRRGSPEHVRDCRGGARIRRADFDRARRDAAGFGVRLLRQLHRRLPDRRADGEARVRHAR